MAKHLVSKKLPVLTDHEKPKVWVFGLLTARSY